jgi:hypothetical protein
MDGPCKDSELVTNLVEVVNTGLLVRRLVNLRAKESIHESPSGHLVAADPAAPDTKLQKGEIVDAQCIMRRHKGS